MRIEFTVNGAPRVVEASPLRRLLDVLREDLRLTGTKEGCGEGECGSCTVLLDGAPVCSCLVPAAHADGGAITTVEGLARGERLSPAQEQLLARGGVQCGACTPGLAVTIEAVRTLEPGADRFRWRELLAGNLCRCTGWNKIVDAAREAAR